ncbi:hypothetical protein [Xanthobacter autotrophicus]|uniref:hypothetical protein n=1 Tax=Xanthobacter autotrophicus TaxID=280 RepID=UPI00372AD49A
MKFANIFILAFYCISLSGCGVGAFDIPREDGAPSVALIVQRVRCELVELIKPDAHTREELIGKNYHVGIQLSLTINSSGDLAPSFNFPQTNTYLFNFGLKLSRAQEQNFVVNLYYSMPQLAQDLDRSRIFAKEAGHPESNAFEQCPSPLASNLTGNLGIKESVDLAFTSPDRNGASLNGTNGEFGGYISFVVTKNVNSAGPTWTLTHFKGPGNLGSLSAVNTDKITFGFASGGPDAKRASYIASQRVKDLLFQLNLTQIQPSRIP